MFTRKSDKRQVKRDKQRADKERVDKERVDKERADTFRRNCDKFRILIIGRANAGKTTILQRMCNTTDAPVIYDKNGQEIDLTVLDPSQRRGIHDIDNEMVFKSNPRFRFHDSCGFEAGRPDEFANVQDFINNRAREPKPTDQLHVIWYCIPLDSSRPYTDAENRFFSECNPGKVPVVVVFTKYDALEVKAYGALKKAKYTPDDAKLQTPDKAKEDFNQIVGQFSGKPHPPRGYVYLRDMHKDQARCSELTAETAKVLEDNESMQQMFVTTQRNNLELCMKYALTKVLMPKLQDGWMGRKVIPGAEYESMTRDLLSWFPQYYRKGSFGFFFGKSLSLSLESKLLLLLGFFADAHVITSRLDFMSGSPVPAQVMLRLGIATVILSDLGYAIWEKGSTDIVSDAIAIYQEQHTHNAIAEAVDKLIVAFHEHGSYGQLVEGAIQIALDNRLLPSM